MSIEKKSLISNRMTIKKANVATAKASATKVSSTKLAGLKVANTLLNPKIIVR